MWWIASEHLPEVRTVYQLKCQELDCKNKDWMTISEYKEHLVTFHKLGYNVANSMTFLAIRKHDKKVSGIEE